MWNRYYPPLVQHYQELLSGSLNAKTFSTYAKLYVDQQVFSPELLRTILMYQQHDYKGLPPDYKLNDIRAVSLFGYQTFEEWFGPRFSDILGKFILNTAALGEKKGYRGVSERGADRFSLHVPRCSQVEEERAVQPGSN